VHYVMSRMPTESRELRAFAPALVLLAICAVINYVDRGNLSIAAPLLKDQLRISASQLGILLSAFFWTYTAMQFFCGWLVESFDVNWVIAAGFLLWSLATAATGLVRGFAMLLAMRLVLGIGESVMMPACSKIFGFHLPEHHRGFANGLLQASWCFGPAVGTLGSGLLIARYGWRPVFIGIGLSSLAWLPAWIRWMPRASARASSLMQPPGSTEILRRRSFWGVCAGHFSVNYLAYFMLTLLPLYLVHERQLSLKSMAKIASAYYGIEALSAVTAGWLADLFIRKGYTPTLVRKAEMVAGQTIAGIALVGCVLTSSQWYLSWLVPLGIGSGAARAGPLTFAQTLAGPHATGKWTGLQNGFANLAGVVAPALSGFLIDRTGKFVLPFVITAVLLGAGSLSWAFWVDRVEQVTWNSEQQTGPAAANT
jgi:MFS transporter, ACS family, D-galactonate transporter